MGSLFKTPKPPNPTPAPPMPDMQSPAVLQAQRKNTELMMQRAGRESTILSAGNGTGGDYSSKTLG